MPEPEPLLSLGLNAPAPALAKPSLPDAESLQFQKAESVEESSAPGAHICGACKRAFSGQYYWVNGVKVCSDCGPLIEAARKAPRPHLLLKAFMWGLGAAIAGTAIYATVTIVTNLQLALIAILIGYLVGKAIRHACQGRGGRPQQIMAVVLTYFSITASFIPIAIHHQIVNASAKKAALDAQAPTSDGTAAAQPQQAKPNPGWLVTLATLVGIALFAPFLSLPSMGGFLSLLIIFWGLQRAWIISGQGEVVITGPHGDGV